MALALLAAHGWLSEAVLRRRLRISLEEAQVLLWLVLDDLLMSEEIEEDSA